MRTLPCTERTRRITQPHWRQASTLAAVLLLAAGGWGCQGTLQAAEGSGDGNVAEEIKPAGTVQLSVTAAPSQAQVGQEVTLTLTATASRALTADLLLYLTGPDGKEAYRGGWSGQALSTTPKTFTEVIVFEAGDAPGSYQVGAAALRGTSKPLFENGALAAVVLVKGNEVAPYPVRHRIDAGGSGGAAMDGDWGADTSAQPSAQVQFSDNRVETAPSAVKGSGVPDYVPASLFQTLRWFSGGGTGHLRYRLPREAGTYRVRLYFVERAHTAQGGRRFHVDLDGQRVLTDFDVFAEAGATRTGVMKEWTRTYAASGETVVELRFGSADAPVISGLELLEVQKAAQTQPGGSAPGGNQRLGLHVTRAELDIWRARWASGVPADAFLTARINEEKSRITGYKNGFVTGGMASGLWGLPVGTTAVTSPQPGDLGCWWEEMSLSDARLRAGRLRDAAFWALIHQDAAVMASVREALHRQPDQSNVKFADNPPWCPLGQKMRDAAVVGFSVAHAVVKHLLTYEYFQIAVKEGWVTDLTPAQHDKIKAWHLAFGRYSHEAPHWRANTPFVDRPQGNYALKTQYQDPNYAWGGRLWVGGPLHHHTHERFNNRFASLARAAMLVGIKYGEADLVSRAKLFFRDFLTYNVYPHGAMGDGHRYDGGNATTALAYQSLQFAHAITAVDALARAGDTSLYDWNPTGGVFDTLGAPHHGSTGGKSFLFLSQTYARYSNNTFARYVPGSNQRLDFRTPSNRGFHDRFVLQNLYYRDLGLTRDLYRGEKGTHPWAVTGNNQSDLNDAWAFPGMYLMWAGLEGVVWPYSP